MRAARLVELLPAAHVLARVPTTMPPTPPPSAGAPSVFPDLLHVAPIAPPDPAPTRLAVALAFAGGLAGGLFDEILDARPLAASTWDPSAFTGDLFLDTFVAQCFGVRIDGQDLAVAGRRIVRILARPPKDPAVVEFRRGVVRELAASPALRRDLEQIYLLLGRFRGMLEGATGVDRWDENRRHLDLLQLVKELFDALADGFATATSGLARLREFGLRVRDGEPYRSLSDLLHYEQNLATLSLEVGVGADGRIRGFEITSVKENTQSPFSTSPLRRWLMKLELFFRGFHFSDGEVMARLIDAVFEGVQDDVVALVRLYGDVEFYLGALGFRDRALAAGMAVALPDLVAEGAPCALHGLFNPLLLPLVAQGKRLVPCDLTLDEGETTVLITGPNSGGKTRLLQALGLAQLLAQGGLFVPARAASLSLARGMVVSIVQETRASQAEGRLGTELVRIRALFEQLLPGTVVILDELCSGTNPSEGEEIFELVVKMLRRLRPRAFLTTHFLAFAATLERERRIEGLRFLQVQLGADQEPTYLFVPGVAKTSLAGQTAARLGVTGEQLLALVERNLARAVDSAPAPAPVMEG
jgi:DNA mismatch repair protein MutS2